MEMKLADFDYELPEDLIAQTPVEPRDTSRLMLLNKQTGDVTHKAQFKEILDELGDGDVLVFNNSRVIPARLHGHRAGSGGRVEVFLLTPCGEKQWECLVKPGKKCPIGQQIIFNDELQGEVTGKTDFGGRIIKFSCTGDFETVLEQSGEVPLPPYITTELKDKERYQTVYAKEKGSVAAPTAGLHFTPELLKALKDKGVQLAFVTLHVGIGTFRPVSVENIKEHTMHTEHYVINQATADLLNVAKTAGKRIVAVGTTSVRTLESAADGEGKIKAGYGETNIFIYPGYQFKLVDALVTNFHLPKSTLLMLISALAGREQCLAAYAEAVRKRYRFFSFGDAMFIY